MSFDKTIKNRKFLAKESSITDYLFRRLNVYRRIDKMHVIIFNLFLSNLEKVIPLLLKNIVL